MKKLKHLKKLSVILDEYVTELKNEIAQIKKEHQKLILLSNAKLISEIAKGENIDEIKLIDKYLKKSKKKSCLKESEKSTEVRKEETLLNHITVEGEDYYYENKPDGNVYNQKSEKVGLYKCGNIDFA